MRKSKLTNDQRRKVVIEALTGNKPIKNLATDYGVYPNTLYYWMEKSQKEAVSQLEEAKKEVAFRKRVLSVLRAKGEME